MTNDIQAMIDEYRNLTVSIYERDFVDMDVLITGYTGLLTGLMYAKQITNKEYQACIIEIANIIQKIS